MRRQLWLAIGAVLAAALLAQSASATVDTAGDTSGHYTGTNTNILNADLVASASGVLQTVGVNFYAAAGNVVVGIYADNAGAPAALLAVSSPQAATTNWNDVDVSGAGVNIVTGTRYWLAFSTSLNCDVYNMAPGRSNSVLTYSYTGTLPNPFGAAGNGQYMMNMRMTYGTVTTTTTTLPPTSCSIPPGRLAKVKFLTPLSPGTHTFRLCTPSACQAGYLTIV